MPPKKRSPKNNHPRKKNDQQISSTDTTDQNDKPSAARQNPSFRKSKSSVIDSVFPAGYHSLRPHAASHLLMVIGLVILTCLLYQKDLNLGFFSLDDHDYVINNPWIKKVTRENITQILTKPYFANYSPGHLLSYMVDYSIAGLSPRTFHWSSNIWGGLVAGMVYLLTVCLTGSRLTGGLSGLLFLAHPVHGEAIVWISSRKDLVAALFATLTLITYIYYRQNQSNKLRWYIVSLSVYVLAISGKQSVVIVPVILWLCDVMIERRPWTTTWADKIPYFIAAVFFALKTMDAQPETRQDFTLVKTGFTIAYNLWLLTGLSDYVIYRPSIAKNPGILLSLAYGIVPVGMALLLGVAYRRCHPLSLVLLTWMIIAMIPPLMLSFIHPVVDRYLFFPSIPFVIAIAILLTHLIKAGSAKALVSSLLSLLIIGTWSYKTWNYISNWNDPRSLWYNATQTSRDCNNFFYLGSHYHESSLAINSLYDSSAKDEKKLQDLADSLWVSNSQLPLLHQEFIKKTKGPVLNEFRKYLLNEALQQFDLALTLKGTEVMPNLYFRRGMVLMEMDQYDKAWQEFELSLEESKKHTFDYVRESLAVYCHRAMGIIRWKQKDYIEARKWLTLAVEEQNKFNGNWIPSLENDLQKLNRIIEFSPPQF